MISFRSSGKTVSERRWSDYRLIFTMLILLVLLYITENLLFHLLIIALSTIDLYCSRNESDSAKACEITLQDKGFDFREQASTYQVFIDYSRIKSVSLKSYRNQATVLIDIDEQSQLRCPMLENPQLLVDELNQRITQFTG